MKPIEEFLINRLIKAYGRPRHEGVIDEINNLCGHASEKQARRAAEHILRISQTLRWPSPGSVLEAITQAGPGPSTPPDAPTSREPSLWLCKAAFEKYCRCPYCLAPARGDIIASNWKAANQAIIQEATTGDWLPQLISELNRRAYAGAIAEWIAEYEPKAERLNRDKFPPFEMDAQTIAICQGRGDSQRRFKDQAASSQIKKATDRIKPMVVH